jgi:hypothetical protein
MVKLLKRLAIRWLAEKQPLRKLIDDAFFAALYSLEVASFLAMTSGWKREFIPRLSYSSTLFAQQRGWSSAAMTG